MASYHHLKKNLSRASFPNIAHAPYPKSEPGDILCIFVHFKYLFKTKFYSKFFITDILANYQIHITHTLIINIYSFNSNKPVIISGVTASHVRGASKIQFLRQREISSLCENTIELVVVLQSYLKGDTFISIPCNTK